MDEQEIIKLCIFDEFYVEFTTIIQKICKIFKRYSF